MIAGALPVRSLPADLEIAYLDSPLQFALLLFGSASAAPFPFLFAACATTTICPTEPREGLAIVITVFHETHRAEQVPLQKELGS